MQLREVITHPRFVGLWTYRPHARPRQFSASVMVDGETQETELFDNFDEALDAAGKILAKSAGWLSWLRRRTAG